MKIHGSGVWIVEENNSSEKETKYWVWRDDEFDLYAIKFAYSKLHNNLNRGRN